jgi:hypothetical protein
MYTYQLVRPLPTKTKSTVVKRIEDNAFIPFDPDNTDYQAYLRWLEEGNTPTPAEENQ